jgi:hypothetical protein
VLREITDNKALFFEQEEPEKIAGAIQKFIQMSPEEKLLMSNEGKIRAGVIGRKENFASSLLDIYQAEIN